MAKSSGRLVSLDISLKHARWNGCTPTDLVFPFFWKTKVKSEK